jgi:hypothetical protein
LCEVRLGLTDRDPYGAGPVLTNCMNDEGAPSAADINQPLAWFEAKLAADKVHLLHLGRVEIIRGIREVRAGIKHISVKPQRIKIVRNIVVITNCFSVALFGMQLPGKTSRRAFPVALFSGRVLAKCSFSAALHFLLMR